MYSLFDPTQEIANINLMSNNKSLRVIKSTHTTQFIHHQNVYKGLSMMPLAEPTIVFYGFDIIDIHFACV